MSISVAHEEHKSKIVQHTTETHSLTSETDSEGSTLCSIVADIIRSNYERIVVVFSQCQVKPCPVGRELTAVTRS